MLTTAVLAFSSFSVYSATDAPARSAKPDLVKGEASYTAVCVACHNADGNASIAINPKLSQQHPEYLLKQLQEFKSGKRKDPVMQGMVAGLSDADMLNISAWLASKPGKLGLPRTRTPWHWVSASTGGSARSPDRCLRGLPQPQWCRHSRPIPALGRPERRLRQQDLA